jgi:hypothetical protein
MNAVALLAVVLLLPVAAVAAGWANIEPGVSTTQDVRERFGAPSNETSAKVEGYDTVQWIYEGERAPAGIMRMTVDFGLLTPTGYKPTAVRLLKLEPKPFIFGRRTVIEGWGIPDGVGNREGFVSFFYKDGLFVVLDKEGETATDMIFSLPQPDAAQQTAPSTPRPTSSAPAKPSTDPKR